MPFVAETQTAAFVGRSPLSGQRALRVSAGGRGYARRRRDWRTHDPYGIPDGCSVASGCGTVAGPARSRRRGVLHDLRFPVVASPRGGGAGRGQSTVDRAVSAPSRGPNPARLLGRSVRCPAAHRRGFWAGVVRESGVAAALHTLHPHHRAHPDVESGRRGRVLYRTALHRGGNATTARQSRCLARAAGDGGVTAVARLGAFRGAPSVGYGGIGDAAGILAVVRGWNAARRIHRRGFVLARPARPQPLDSVRDRRSRLRHFGNAHSRTREDSSHWSRTSSAARLHSVRSSRSA